MSRTAEIVRGIAILALALAGFAWFCWRVLKKSDDPPRLIFKWLLTAGIVAAAYFTIHPVARGRDPGGLIAAVIMACVFGLALAIVWRQNMASIVAKPFGNLYDGGSEPPIPEAFFSVAQARRKQGKYQEAIYEIQNQLARFPYNPIGHLLMAEIQAENLNDLTAAQMTIERYCALPGLEPRNVAAAFNLLADLHLKIAQDRDAARAALEQITARLPDTEEAQLAAQRIAHLPDSGHLMAPHDRAAIKLKHGIEDLGLLSGPPKMHTPEATPPEQAAAFVRHLEAYPLDAEAREQLACIYSDHYQRLDLAADQLEQLINHPNQPLKEVVRWLNLLADLQVKHAQPLEEVQQTLERIVALKPDAAFAQQAHNRLALLKMEYRKNEKGQTLQLGAYEQDLGLKTKKPPN